MSAAAAIVDGVDRSQSGRTTMATLRQDITNLAMYRGSGGLGAGPGVYMGSGVTRTKASKTLYVAMLPRGATAEQVEALFRTEAGFVALRMVRRMCFIDFETDRFATEAMRKFQDHVFPGAERGIAIDYDKDPVDKRNRNADRQRREQALREQLLATDQYGCSICGCEVLNLDPPRRLADMPVRRTDGAFAVHEARYVRRLHVSRAPLRLLRITTASDSDAPPAATPSSAAPMSSTGTPGSESRIERQFPILCPHCNAHVGYRTAPPGTPCPRLYIHSGSLFLLRPAGAAIISMFPGDGDADGGDGPSDPQAAALAMGVMPELALDLDDDELMADEALGDVGGGVGGRGDDTDGLDGGGGPGAMYVPPGANLDDLEAAADGDLVMGETDGLVRASFGGGVADSMVVTGIGAAPLPSATTAGVTVAMLGSSEPTAKRARATPHG